MKGCPVKKRYVRTPTVYQMESAECGAASLAMVLGYYGVYVPLEKIRIETGVSRDGCNAQNILSAARKYGLRGNGYKKSLDNLLETALPCIIHWNFNHFVVYEGKKGSFFYINDPGIGRRKVTYEEMNSSFTGIVMEFQVSDEAVPSFLPKKLWKFALWRLKGQYGSMLCLAAVGILLVFPGIFLPAFTQFFVDYLLKGKYGEYIAQFCAAMALTILLRGALTWYRGILLGFLQKKMSMLSAYSFLAHMLRLPMNFFEQRYAGDLSGRVESNNSINDFLTGDLGETVLNILTTVFYLILFFVYSPILTCVVLVNVLVNAAAAQYSLHLTKDAAVKMQQDQGRLYGTVVAGIGIIDTLKASGAEENYISRIMGYYAKTIGQEQRYGRTQQIISAVPQAARRITQTAVMLLGGLLVLDGKMTVGMLIAYVSLLGNFLLPIEKLMFFINRIQTLRADVSRVEDIYHYEQDPRFSDAGKQDTQKYEKLTGEVDLEGITFGYSPVEAPLLKNVGFHVDTGKTVGIVGPSGCGKSTILKLVSGLYAPWGGSIKIDGTELSQIRKDILAASVSTVSQETTIFSGTVRDNLTMWNKSILEEDMVKSAKDACLHEEITKKPGVYEYRLDEGGQNLSGGQRQRLEIARALATNPSILIMDEATSALDPLVEKKIIDNIKRRGCTCMIVAHRLSAIRDCDEILVMDRGQIIQRGNHEELKDQEGAYKKLLLEIRA